VTRIPIGKFFKRLKDHPDFKILVERYGLDKIHSKGFILASKPVRFIFICLEDSGYSEKERLKIEVLKQNVNYYNREIPKK
jgi:hypothetical protein